jgi:undecaprenyl-phosphate 4-deoxy-4-formamido-L-arabinose transferase
MEISIVIPVYNSSENLPPLFKGIEETLKNNFNKYELIFVNDHSGDNSWEVIEEICKKNPWVKGIDLRKNVGQHNATFAGLKICKGEKIVTMDDDGQNSPNDIINLFNKVKEGSDVCYANYKLKKHNLYRRLGSLINNFFVTLLFKKKSSLTINAFRCFNKDINNEIIKTQSPYIYIDGIILSLTNNISKLSVDHNDRKFGKSNYTFFNLVNLWIIVATGYSIVPLRIASFFGIVFSIFGFIMSIWIIFQTALYGDTPGWASLIVVILILGGLQLFALGIMGEYLGKSYLTLNKQPQYSIKKKINIEIKN